MFNKILFPVDLSHQQLALDLAPQVEQLARSYDAQIETMTVIAGLGMPIVANYFPADAEQQALAEADRQLQAFAAQAFSQPTAHSVRTGTHWRQIIDTANRHAIDLIVMPHCNKGWPETVLLGSCSAKVSQHANCSVLILRSAGRSAGNPCSD